MGIIGDILSINSAHLVRLSPNEGALLVKHFALMKSTPPEISAIL